MPRSAPGIPRSFRCAALAAPLRWSEGGLLVVRRNDEGVDHDLRACWMVWRTPSRFWVISLFQKRMTR